MCATVLGDIDRSFLQTQTTLSSNAEKSYTLSVTLSRMFFYLYSFFRFHVLGDFPRCRFWTSKGCGRLVSKALIHTRVSHCHGFPCDLYLFGFRALRDLFEHSYYEYLQGAWPAGREIHGRSFLLCKSRCFTMPGNWHALDLRFAMGRFFYDIVRTCFLNLVEILAGQPGCRFPQMPFLNFQIMMFQIHGAWGAPKRVLPSNASLSL